MRLIPAIRAVLPTPLLLWLGLWTSSLSTLGISQAQPLHPGIYVGFGTGTNVGGTVGLGVEIPVAEHLTASAAIGLWPEALGSRTHAPRAFDFDLGLKIYPVNPWLFGGINYGIIHAEIIATEPGSGHLRKRRGFTFSVGARTLPMHGIYASLFAGITSDAKANYMEVFDSRTFIPHVGLLVGLTLFHKR